MILVAGLGNPGKGYDSSRHNIGFIVIDELAKRLGVSVKKKGFRSHYAQAPIDEKKLILLKPDTYMNRSGEAVSEAAEFFKIPAKELIVRAADAVIEIVLRGAESAMNKFNKKPEATPKPRK